MKYIEVQWSFEYDNTLGDLTEEEHDKWLNHPTLSRAYVPEEMVTEGVDVIELAFERLTGIPKKHIVVFDMEADYVLDEDLDFVDILELHKEGVSNYHKEIKDVLIRMLELVNTNGDTDEFNHLLDDELPYLWWGQG